MLIYWSFQVLRWILQWSKLLSISISTLKNTMVSFELCFYFYSESFFLGTWSHSLYLSLELLSRKCQRPPTPGFLRNSGMQSQCLLGMNVENQSNVYHISFPVAPFAFLLVPLFVYHLLLISPQRRSVFFQKPDISNSWPGVGRQPELSVIWLLLQPAEISLSKWRQK